MRSYSWRARFIANASPMHNEVAIRIERGEFSIVASDDTAFSEIRMLDEAAHSLMLELQDYFANNKERKEWRAMVESDDNS